jgi:hypothetical protein
MSGDIGEAWMLSLGRVISSKESSDILVTFQCQVF